MGLNCLMVGVGGAAGAIARYLLSALPVRTPGGFPLATLGINVLGAFCIGLTATAACRHAGLSPHLFLLLKVGLCGGFTTFSTFSLETVQLLQNGKYGAALAYAALSVVLCASAVFGAEAWMLRGR